MTMNDGRAPDFPPPNEFLVRSTDGDSLILQRVSDGYINATALCKACGKLLADYLRLSSTGEYFSALEADMGIPITELVQSRRGGNPTEQGTWVHPQVAIHLAQWASPQFAVKVANWVHEWLRGELVTKPSPSTNPFELIIQQATAMLELQKSQLVLSNRQSVLEQRQEVAEDRIEALENKVESVAGGPDCYTVKGYARTKHLPMPNSLAKEIGKRATKMCTERGLPIGDAKDETFGIVNSYPEEILSIIFFQMNLHRSN